MSTLSLTREMTRRGHRVFIKGNEGPMSGEFHEAGAVVIFSSKPFQRSIAGILSDARDIKTLVLKENIDIIHSQSVFPTISAYCALRGLPVGPQLIFHERGIGKFSYHVVPKLFNYLVDCVIANSDYEAAILKRNGLRVPCIRIHNCSNIHTKNLTCKNLRNELGINKNTRVLGIVGRLVKQKGHIFLLEAFRRVVGEIKDGKIVLLIVGDGPLRKAITRKVQKWSLESNVIFTGFRRDLERVYPAMDMLLVPSLFEPFGNVAVEASAWGVPVIAAAVGGLPEALQQGKSGLLVPPGDVDKLTSAIMHLLENPDVARNLGARGIKLASMYFTPERVANEVEGVYEQLLKKN